MKNMFKKILYTTAFSCLFLGITLNANAAKFFLSPATQFSAGCNSVINIMIDTQGATSTAADALINFNPAEVTIVDQNLTIPGTQLRAGNIFEFYPGNTITGAKMFLTGASIMTDYTTSGAADIYGSIILKSNPGVTSTTLTFDYTPGATVDSNISDVTGAVDLLSSALGQTYTFVDTGYCGSDTIPPVVVNSLPAPSARGILASAGISFDIKDNLSGVDIDTVVVTLDGVDYSNVDSEFTYTVIDKGFHVVIMPLTDYVVGAPVYVSIVGEDTAGNVMSPYEYRFNLPIVDNAPPYVRNTNPGSGDTNVALNSSVTMHILDDLSGVKKSTIIVTIEGHQYTDGDGNTVISGSPNDYFVLIDPITDFILDDPVSVNVEAYDLSNNKGTYSYSFNHPLVDNQPPYVNSPQPSPGNRQVALDANISFYLRDNVSGVDIDTVVVNIDGVEYTQSDFMTLSGDINDYYIEIDPISDFAEGQEIIVTVDAIDTRGNVMNTYEFKFNKPAICGDGVVEDTFGEQCEPPGTPGCTLECTYGVCEAPLATEPVCGNLIVEEFEECEPPNSGTCDSTCKVIRADTNVMDQYSLFGGFIGLNVDEQNALNEMVQDSDGDGLPDSVEAIYNTDIGNSDSDGDGFSDLEEILDYGTDPLVYDKLDYRTRIVDPKEGAITGEHNIFIRGISYPGKDVSIFATDLEGNDYFLGKTVPGNQGKFALPSEISLDDGEYLIYAESYQVDGTLIDESNTVDLTIDSAKYLEAPTVKSINDVIIKPDEIPVVYDPQPMVAGSTVAGAQVVSVFESSIFSSTIISDNLSGFFTVFAPRPLEIGAHKVTVYAITQEGIISSAKVVTFEVAEKAPLLYRAGWWWWILILIILILLIVAAYYKYKKWMREREIKQMKLMESKLVLPSSGEDVDDGSGSALDLFEGESVDHEDDKPKL